MSSILILTSTVIDRSSRKADMRPPRSLVGRERYVVHGVNGFDKRI
jgi:hypothetical protein